jgi:hypothetical protein
MSNDGFTINPKLYDFLKWIALVLLPAVATLYAGMGSLWHFPAVTEVVGSITALDTFLGLVLKKSSSNYGGVKMMGDFVVKVDLDGNANGMKIVADKEFIPQEGDTVAFRVTREQALG